jgi:DNA-binding CsgD family transcriptional regulator
MHPNAPKVFVSYSWDSPEHKAWVEDFAKRLRDKGVDAILDRWELHPGDELPAFMEKSIRESSFVVVVCTPRYKAKCDGRTGGAGYEGGIITAELFAGVATRRKFIPVLRQGSWPEAAPTWCSSSLMIDLRDGPSNEENFMDLLKTLWGARIAAPPLGISPFIAPSQPPSAVPTEPSVRAQASVRQVDTSGPLSFHIPIPDAIRSKLTPSEAIIAQEVLRGLRDKEIANARDLSIEIVKTHIRNILSKLGVDSRFDLLQLAIRLTFGPKQTT